MDTSNTTTTRKIRRSPIKNGSFNNGNNSKIKIKNESKTGNNLSNKIIELQHQLAEYDDEFKELIESNEFLATEKQILEETLEDAEQKIKQLTQTKDELEKLINLKKDEFQSTDLSNLNYLKIENENLKNELEFKKQEIDKLKSKLNLKEEIIQEQNKKLEEKDDRIDNLKKQINEYNLKLYKLEDNYKEKINQLRTDYLQKDEQYNVMVTKYIKHRKIWEDNYEKANYEVKKLDEVIDNVVNVLKNKIDIVGQIPEIKLLLDQLTSDQ